MCGVDNHWLGRIKIIRTKLKNDTISEYACKVRYGDKWYEKQSELKNKVKITFNNLKNKYGETIATEKWEEIKRNRKTYGKQIMIDKYGEEEGILRWEKALSSKINTMHERKKIKP